MLKISGVGDQPATASASGVSAAPRSAPGLLRAVRAAEAAVRRAEADKLELALEWAHLHPSATGVQNDDDAAVHFHQFGVANIAGDGCPGVAEFAIPEFGTVLGVSTTTAKTMIGHALELFHRLPKCWARVQEGEAPAWRARKVAEPTIHAVPELPAEAAAWIDAQVAPFLAKLGPAQVDRVIERAIKLYGLARVEPECPDDPNPPAPLDGRHVSIDTRRLNSDGTVDLAAQIDLADAIDLDSVVRAGAEELKTLGSAAPLDVRRAEALGHLARRQLALDLTPGAAAGSGLGAGATTGGEPEEQVDRSRATAARRVVLNLHFDASIRPDNTVGVSPTGTLEQGQLTALLEQVKAWLNTSHTDVRIQPVIDLNTEITCAGYAPSARLRRQIELRDQTCVFPWCTRPAVGCDLDHTDAYDHDAGVDETEARPGDRHDGPPQTRTSNLGALCRFHHHLKTGRLKTVGHHNEVGNWQVEQPRSGVFIWTSPHGHQFLRDHHGTHALDPPLVTAQPEPQPEPGSAVQT